MSTPIRDLNLREINEHTADAELPELLRPLREGRSMGLLSEAGCPAVVALAHREGFEVRPLIGPSSILLALMASGANGQSFAFKGYLPADAEGRKSSLKKLECRSRQENETQLFIETPYRNNALLADALATLSPDTRLCAACDLTLPTQTVISQNIARWRAMKALPDLKKRPTLFVLSAA